MKKMILILLILVTLSFCFACEKDNKTDDNGDNENQLPSDFPSSVTLPEDVFE